MLERLGLIPSPVPGYVVSKEAREERKERDGCLEMEEGRNWAWCKRTGYAARMTDHLVRHRSSCWGRVVVVEVKGLVRRQKMGLRSWHTWYL